MFGGHGLAWVVELRVLVCCTIVLFLYSGTWCSGITSALHAEGPGFNPPVCPFSVCVCQLQQIVLWVRACLRTARTVWPSGLRRWLKAPVRKGVGSNPTAVIFNNYRGGGADPDENANADNKRVWQDSLAEWSKALAQGASPQERGFEPHSCHLALPAATSKPQLAAA